MNNSPMHYQSTIVIVAHLWIGGKRLEEYVHDQSTIVHNRGSKTMALRAFHANPSI